MAAESRGNPLARENPLHGIAGHDFVLFGKNLQVSFSAVVVDVNDDHGIVRIKP